MEELGGIGGGICEGKGSDSEGETVHVCLVSDCGGGGGYSGGGGTEGVFVGREVGRSGGGSMIDELLLNFGGAEEGVGDQTSPFGEFLDFG